MNTNRPGGRRNDLTWHSRFIAAIVERGTITAGCKAAGIDRHTYYDHFRKFPDFAAAVGAANEEIADQLETEAFRRAVHGVSKIVGYDRDGKSLTATKYSDRLLILLLKKRRPEIYGDHAKQARLPEPCPSQTATKSHEIYRQGFGIIAQLRREAMARLRDD